MRRVRVARRGRADRSRGSRYCLRQSRDGAGLGRVRSRHGGCLGSQARRRGLRLLDNGGRERRERRYSCARRHRRAEAQVCLQSCGRRRNDGAHGRTRSNRPAPVRHQPASTCARDSSAVLGGPPVLRVGVERREASYLEHEHADRDWDVGRLPVQRGGHAVRPDDVFRGLVHGHVL